MSLPRMSFHIGDYLKDTKHLNAAQHGAYVLLIMHYWANGSLPDDDKQLAQIACMKAAEWRKARPVIHALFKNDRNWKHKRIEKEIADAEKKYRQKIEAGKKSAEKRKASENVVSTDVVTNVATENQRTAQQPITLTDNQLHDGGEVRAQALAIAERIESLCGYSDPKSIPPGFCGGPLLVEKWLNSGWRPEIIIPAVQEALARKRDGPPDNPIYFEKPIARAHARHAAPLPQVKPGVSDERVGRGSGPATSWQASRDDWRSALADLKRTVAESEIDGKGGDGSERGGQIIQLAAPARRG